MESETAVVLAMAIYALIIRHRKGSDTPKLLAQRGPQNVSTRTADMRRMIFITVVCLLGASWAATGPSAASSPPRPSGERDYFHCFQAGSCTEPALTSSPTCRRNRDYSITATKANSDVIVLSFHGGRIEANTSGVSNQLAIHFGWSRYDFSAHGTSGCLGNLNDHYRFHITAPHFDDPVIIAIVGRHRIAVSIHGYSPYRSNTVGTICVGGRNAMAVSRFIGSVQQSRAHFAYYDLRPYDVTGGSPTGVDCAAMTGTSRLDPINRTSGSAGGMQLELSPRIDADMVGIGAGADALRAVIDRAVQAATAP